MSDNDFAANFIATGTGGDTPLFEASHGTHMDNRSYYSGELGDEDGLDQDGYNCRYGCDNSYSEESFTSQVNNRTSRKKKQALGHCDHKENTSQPVTRKPKANHDANTNKDATHYLHNDDHHRDNSKTSDIPK